LTGRWIKKLLYIDLEALPFCASAMIGEIEALLDERVDIDRPVFARTFARVQQHILDDGVGAFAVLNDLVEVVAQSVRQFSDFAARFVIARHSAKAFPQFVDQFRRNPREIVDEIERVFDLVGNARCELPERCQLLGLDKAILRRPQVLQRLGQFARAALDTLEQPRILYRQHRLRREGL